MNGSEGIDEEKKFVMEAGEKTEKKGGRQTKEKGDFWGINK